METTRLTGDKGASLIEYGLIVALISMVALFAVANVGTSVSDSFSDIGDSVAAADAGDAGMTPYEIWQQAKQDYDQAINDAKAKKNADLDQAKADYDTKLANNSSLPKAEKKAANKQAKNEYNAAKTQVNNTYKSSVATAKTDRDTAKAAYQASK